MSGGGITFDDDLLDASALAALRLEEALQGISGLVRRVPLAGGEPHAIARARAALEAASRELSNAAELALEGSVALAGLASDGRAWDEAGSLGVFGAQTVRNLGEPRGLGDLAGTAAGLANDRRTAHVERLLARVRAERAAASSPQAAAELWNRDPWRRERWPSPQAMHASLGSPVQGRRRDATERLAKRIGAPEHAIRKVVERVPEAIRRHPLVDNRVLRAGAKAFPVVGTGIGYVDNERKYPTREAIGRTGAQGVGSAATAAAAGGVAGAICVSTAPVCGAVVAVAAVAGGVLGSEVAGAAYTPAKELISSALRSPEEPRPQHVNRRQGAHVGAR